MEISQGLVGTNQALNWAMGKRERLIFRYCLSISGDASPISDVLE